MEASFTRLTPLCCKKIRVSRKIGALFIFAYFRLQLVPNSGLRKNLAQQVDHQRSLTKVDAECDKQTTVVGRKLTALATVDV